MRTATAKGEQSRRLLLDLSEGVVGGDAHGQIDRSSFARAEETLARIGPEQRWLQQPFLGGQCEYRISHAATLDPRGAHFGDDVAKPAGMNATSWPERIGYRGELSVFAMGIDSLCSIAGLTVR